MRKATARRNPLHRLTLDISQLFGHFPVRDLKHVHAPQVPWLPFFCLVVDPPYHAAVPGGEDLFGLEKGIRISGKEFFPIRSYGCRAFHRSTVGGWIRVLEYAVFRH